jgi:putative transposase
VHLVFTPRYRREPFTSAILDRYEQIMAEVGTDVSAELREFNGETDHVQLLVHYPPKVALSRLVNSLEGVSARHLCQEFPTHIRKYLWGEHFWSPPTSPAPNPPPEMAPGRATILAGLPPAYIAVAGYDPLRDDGLHYWELLAAGGVPVEVHNVETMVHAATPLWSQLPRSRWSAGWPRYTPHCTRFNYPARPLAAARLGGVPASRGSTPPRLAARAASSAC